MDIFKLVGSIFVDNEAANESISKTDKKAGSVAETFGKGIGTAAKWGATIVAGAATAATAIGGMAIKTAETADVVDKMSAKIGLSKEGFQEWSYIMGQNGMDIDKMQVGVKTLVAQMDGAANGTKSAQENFDKLGLSIYDSTGKMKDQETIMEEALYALADMENGTEKARLATELFGKSGSEMMPMLNQGSAGMQDLKDRAHELGLVMSDDTVNAGVVLGDTIDDVKQSLSMLATNLGATVMPIVQQLADLIISNLPTIQGMVASLAPVFSSLLTGLLPPIIELVTMALPIMVDLFNKIMPFLAEAAKAILPIIVTLLQTFLPPLLELAQIVLPLVAQLLGAIMPLIQALMPLLAPILQIVVALIAPIAQLLSELLTPLINMLTELINAVMPYITAEIQKLSTMISSVLNLALSALMPIIENVKGVFKGLIDFIAGVFSGDWNRAFNGIITTLKNLFSGIVNIVRAPFDAATNVVRSAIDRIKSFFNFSWSLPKIKLPHFSIDGNFSLNPLRVPSFGIDWYAKAMEDGMIMNKPTPFGINGNGQVMAGGEVGSETVVGTQSLMQMVQNASSSGNKEMASMISSAVVEAIEGLVLNANLNVTPDDRQILKIVEKQAKIQKKATGREVFA
jgi:hypothetical protein